MAETDLHRDQLTDPLYAIRWYFRDDPDVYVTGNILLFYEPNNRRKHVSPDLFLVRGVERKRRNQYLLWEEKAPDLVLEISSSSTWEEDFGQKKAVYARIGVEEYYLFDPTGSYLIPPLRAYRLVGEDYLPVIGALIHSDALGLDLVVVDGVLRLASASGELLPIPEEAYRGWELEVRRADEQQRRADEQQRRADEQQRRADEQRRRADEEQVRADHEKERAEAALRAIEELRLELRRLKSEGS